MLKKCQIKNDLTQEIDPFILAEILVIDHETSLVYSTFPTLFHAQKNLIKTYINTEFMSPKSLTKPNLEVITQNYSQYSAILLSKRS